MRSPSLVATLLVVATCCGTSLATAGMALPGVMVESVLPGGAAERAGLREGDVVHAWQRIAAQPTNRTAAEGGIGDELDLAEVELEQAARGEVTLLGTRQGSPCSWSLPPGDWGLQVQPLLEGVELARFQHGRELVDSGTPEAVAGGVALWRDLAQTASRNGDHRLAGALLLRIAEALAAAKQPDAALATFDEADAEASRSGDTVLAARVAQAGGRWLLAWNQPDAAAVADDEALCLREQLAPGSLAVAASLTSLGSVAQRRGDLAVAQSFYERSLAIRLALAPESLIVAASLTDLGTVAQRRGDLEAAEDYFRGSLAIREELVPDSLEVAKNLNNLGVVAKDRGDLDAAEAYHRRALALKEKLAPGSLTVAASLNNLGIVALERDDLATAESCYRRSLTIQQKLAPDSLAMAASLTNLGAVAERRGDLAAAEGYRRRSLALYQRLAPESLELATALTNLGTGAWKRGDVAAAEDYFRQSLALRERLAPGSLAVADCLNDLGATAWSRDDLQTAEGYYRASLTIREKLAPGSLEVANSLSNLGNVAMRRGNLDAAEGFYRAALAVREKLAPKGLDVAASAINLAAVAWAREDLSAAEAFYRQALAIGERLAPESQNMAISLHGLAEVLRLGGRLEPALTFASRAIEVAETQAGKLGGTEEIQADFRATFADYYRDDVDLLVATGATAQAFHVLERSRAQQLLALLAERDLAFGADVPPALDQDQRLANAEYERELAKLATADVATREQVERRLDEIRRRQGEIREQIRHASPRLAALQYPSPLDLAAAHQALDPGTLLLAWSIGMGSDKPEESGAGSYLFAVGPGESELAVYRLAVTDATVRHDVFRFRTLIERHRDEDLPAIRKLASELTEALLAPASAQVARADRLLLVPDGALHILPFAALADPGTMGNGGARLLVEAKPITVVASATLFAELKRSRRTRERFTVAAFGDPHYPSASDAKHGAGTTVPALNGLEPLPSSRLEVERLRQLYPGSASIYLGADATEERAKALGRDVAIVHFACHGIVDERFPLESALALSIPDEQREGQDNGLLQAFEIFETVRLDADLVTLSACDTALGKESGGEGIVGLTRAFQYAGARSVLASLWNVGDESTADLVGRFYGYLKKGRSKDQALRSAQLDLLARGDAWSHPFHWAVLSLFGDWR